MYDLHHQAVRAFATRLVGDPSSAEDLVHEVFVSLPKAMKNYRAGNYVEAQRDFDSVANGGGENSASAALFAAQAVRASSGCTTAASRFESVGTKFRGSGVGNEATWQAADCYRSLGRTEDARRNYQALLEAPGYGDRAQLALAALDTDRVASRKAKAAAGASLPAVKAAPAPAKPAAKPTTEPKTDTPGNAF